MSEIIAEERERFSNLALEKHNAVQETQFLPPKNENITSFNGRPTLDALYQRHERKVTVDVSYLMELVEFFEKRTSATIEEFINSRKRYCDIDKQNDDLRKSIQIKSERVKEIMVENTLAYKEIEELKAKQSKDGIVKLSIGKVSTFLRFCKPSDDDMFFYVKMEEGSMSRISRSKSDLE